MEELGTVSFSVWFDNLLRVVGLLTLIIGGIWLVCYWLEERKRVSKDNN